MECKRGIYQGFRETGRAASYIPTVISHSPATNRMTDGSYYSNKVVGLPVARAEADY